LEAESSGLTSCSSEGDLPSPTANSSSHPAGSSSSTAAAAAAAAAVLSELSHLEAELEVDDILLCRSLAELALDRRIASSTGAVGVDL
jgi:shikimate kinase